MAKKELTERQKRCQDCANLVEKYGGIWTCSECFGQLCDEIDDCPEGVTIEDIKQNEEIEKTNTFKLVASAEDKPKRKPRERKADEAKRELVNLFKESLASDENVTEINVTNIEREIEFKHNGRKFKITLSAPRS